MIHLKTYVQSTPFQKFSIQSLDHSYDYEGIQNISSISLSIPHSLQS